MKKIEVVTGIRYINDDLFYLHLELPEKITFLPGQYVAIEPLDPRDVMLRPFSVSSVKDEKHISLLIQKRGVNSNLYSQLKDGAKLSIIAPLGNPQIFDSIKEQDLWLVGGGIGIAPILFLWEYFSNQVKRTFYGGKHFRNMIHLDVNRLVAEYGLHHDVKNGLVTEWLEKDLSDQTESPTIITCGPVPMMKEVARICEERDLTCLVYLEKVMACGIGVCKGCSCHFESGQHTVCQEGPVFNSKEVHWDEFE